MPLKSGYSHATFSANLAEFLRAGHERDSAIMASASKARQSFFRRFPAGALPNWLSFPKSHRTAKHYDSGGRPLMGGVQNNPSPLALRARVDRSTRQKALGEAAALYQGFTGHAPHKIRPLPVKQLPHAALAIGKVFCIMYSVDATGERFKHDFKRSAQPLLIVSPDGQQVFLHGGAYTFTKRGFVDLGGA